MKAEAASATTAGSLMADEIAAQPAVFRTLLAAGPEIRALAGDITRRRPRFVLFAARGSSDHAALYGKYLVETLLGLPAGLVSPSATTLYGARQDLRDVLLVTVSQSGGSPDLVEVAATARDQGALTVAVTNTEGSDLVSVTDAALSVRAGAERAVAATKTYTATLLALYLLVDALRGGHGERAEPLGDLADEALAGAAAPVVDLASRLRFADRLLTVGRGYSSATAGEAALKLAETSYLLTRAYSAADLLHGPVAAVDADTALLAVTSVGPGGTSTLETLEAVRERGPFVAAIGSASASAAPDVGVALPATPEEVAPVLEVLPAQLLALELARARGVDPDRPRGLNKVTRTR
ncbi:glucosamine-6-phosphate deaminase [Actinoalloteichus sp. AHMU CJ021]|uniref:SIS domain-containing protein n=1 Tax=Actinoalloteichus sp. AHMU CJ021 TaxID=2072503 RepID=UPI000CA044CB|nr:glucosamine-6-phosphate deaminase [Actinoalloteichus sp. AHMU CJ021]